MTTVSGSRPGQVLLHLGQQRHIVSLLRRRSQPPNDPLPHASLGPRLRDQAGLHRCDDHLGAVRRLPPD